MNISKILNGNGSVGIRTVLIFVVVALAVHLDPALTQETALAPSAFFEMSAQDQVIIHTEGDLLMTLDQYRFLHQPARQKRGKRKAIRFHHYLWSDATVFYSITDKDLNSDVIERAVAHWRENVCLRFIKSNVSTNRLNFVSGSSCRTFPGMQKGVQEIFLHPSCFSFGTVVHELGHAIGFFHEHSRADRDRYIKINYDVIPQVWKAQFDKTYYIESFNIPYDYLSVMHYGDLGVIKTLDPDYQKKIGQEKGLSFKDIKLSNLLYKCATRANCPSVNCPFNGFVFSKAYKGQPACACWCDTGKVEDPLVLCSSIDREVPAPNPQKTIIPDQDQPRCVDMVNQCYDFKLQGYCRTEIPLMLSTCPAKCGYCKKDQYLCIDSDNSCGMMAASGLCTDESFKDMMKIICPKSCNLCTILCTPCFIEEVLNSD